MQTKSTDKIKFGDGILTELFNDFNALVWNFQILNSIDSLL